ncbi:DNA topoisomerase 2 [Camellia lanceoleosa]|uniref:DNA topoisomerase 2 n=1 Tax=Camellia lanceoleosa TaxID=1840588 RepID=A0ACC0FFQ7_9ERIC|nr:DNA topoisomerase 2 [Camellia lanceoleosa]
MSLISGLKQRMQSGELIVSFVNSIATIKGGTHVDYVTNQITNYVMSIVNKKNKNANLKAHAVKIHLCVFVNALIDNPAFDSQTKETLTIRQSNFGSKCELSQEFLKKVSKSGIVESLLSWADFKQSKDLKKTATHKNGKVLAFYSMPEYESWKESLGGNASGWSIKYYKANKILMKKIEDDQFLDLMTLKTEVRSACKEPYRYVLKSENLKNGLSYYCTECVGFANGNSDHLCWIYEIFVGQSPLQGSYFGSSGVSGAIPSTFAALRNLQTVWALDNELTSSILEFIGNWSKLKSFTAGGAANQGALGPFGLLVLADESLSEQTPIYFYVAKGAEDKLKTFFCADESRSSKATDVMKPIYGSTVPMLKGEKFSMRILHNLHFAAESPEPKPEENRWANKLEPFQNFARQT